MSLTLDEYRTKLINKILFASTQDEAGHLVTASLTALEQKKINGHIISRFIDKVLYELELFSPMDQEAQQWSNIKIAMIHFLRIKNGFQSSPAKQ